MLAAYEASYGREVAQSLAAYYVPYFSQMGIDVSDILDRQTRHRKGTKGIGTQGFGEELDMPSVRGGMRGTGVTPEDEVLAPDRKKIKSLFRTATHV